MPGHAPTRRAWLLGQLGLMFGFGAGTGALAQPGPSLAPAPSAGAANGPRWLAAWAVAERDYRRQMVAPGLPTRAPRVFNDQTVRLRISPALGGRQWRVRLSNRWALEPLLIDQASLALATGGAALSPRTVVPLRFGGQPGLTLAPGATAWSNAVQLPARAGQTLALSFHIARPFSVAAGYPVQREGGACWLLPGNQCLQPRPQGAQAQDWAPALSALDVMAPRDARLLVAFGDSLTEGGGAADTTELGSYPQRLAVRLRDQRPSVSVVNTGLGGNRLLREGVGDSALQRFEREVLQQSGVTHALVLIGINDLGFGTANGERSPLAPAAQLADAPQLIAGLQKLQAAAQARGVKLLLGTLMPFGGAPTWSEHNEAQRQAVNRWIRGRQDVAGVVDFDAATRDAAHPLRLRPAFDSGDHLHLNAAGLAAMADAVDLEELRE
ncbi:GDSL-type esterase/lipase family protein [Xenophilus arseniciresistens]|uniref:GDSL-type esterase/lipase family protein n=1 Tax=Xenophilus arseniciresistens TaxID=1283306 RepID=A0AAE3T156_9BURK|nr:GDSL-type esterase/lipase family protein [Xenophilus arseniciresistens]MDA7418922.1 GDSL-type esterase/lipase family protein [Xenophilus arseniciresistens]